VRGFDLFLFVKTSFFRDRRLITLCQASLLGGIRGGASLSGEADGPFTATISMALLSSLD
jgi:hypothetical protein